MQFSRVDVETPIGPPREARIVLLPCERVVARAPAVIEMALGTGVAVTVWDPVEGNGGLCHFVQGVVSLADGAAGKRPDIFGAHALATLWSEMAQAGSPPTRCRHRVLGAEGGERPMGDANARYAARVIREAGYELGACWFGDGQPSRVRFSLATGAVDIQCRRRDGLRWIRL